jgi:hypothetical protein
VEFLEKVILREGNRLLAIDGNIIMNKNLEKEQHFFNYYFSMHLENL